MFGTSAAIFSVLLMVTGLAKLRRPDETSRAIAFFGLPSHRLLGSGLGALELGVGLVALVTASPWALGMQGLTYLGFVAWVAAAMRSKVPLSSCGCLGRDDTPPYWGHLVLDGVAVSVTFAAIRAPAPIPVALSLETAANLVVIGVGVLLAWVIIDHGARLSGAMNR